MKQPTIHAPATVDLWSILLPDHIYVKFIDWLHPNEPAMEAVKRAVAMMTPEDRAYTLSRARQVREYADTVEKVLQK